MVCIPGYVVLLFCVVYNYYFCSSDVIQPQFSKSMDFPSELMACLLLNDTVQLLHKMCKLLQTHKTHKCTLVVVLNKSSYYGFTPHAVFISETIKEL